MARTFKKSDVYKEDDLLQFARGHLACAKMLYDEGGFVCLDSAAFLSHLGIELIFKAWLLNLKKEHKDWHNLLGLYDALLESGVKDFIQGEHKKCLETLQGQFDSRYPPHGEPIEVGGDDLPKVEALLDVVLDNMPDHLRNKFSWSSIGEDGSICKGGRTIMRKRKEPRDSLHSE